MPEKNDGKIQLRVEVSKRDRVKIFGFAYDDLPENPSNEVTPVLVSKTTGKGIFWATPGQMGNLIWGIEGDAGGSMKVEVFRDDVLVEHREKSSILANGEGVDYLEILV